MKKFLKTLTKKSIALLMTVVMLMTCWVFVAPEKAEAATTAKYSFTLTYNLGSGETGGDIKVYYYNFRDDGSGVDTSSTGEEYVVDSYGKLTAGDGKTYTHNCTGFPYKIEFKDNDGCNNRQIRITGFSINGVSVGLAGGFNVSDTTYTITYNGSGASTSSITWALPVVSSISLSPTAPTVNVPAGGTGSATVTATVKDQYGYQYHKLTTSNCTMNPQVDGISTSVSNNVITVKGTEAVFANHSGYSSTTGAATSTLSVLMGNSGTKTASVKFQSPKYTVAFTGCACGSNHNQTCYYNGSVTAPSITADNCKKNPDNNYHYAFNKWLLSTNSDYTLAQGATLSGIKANGTTYNANYTATAHVFEGALVNNGDGTHSKKCTSVGADKTCTIVGLNGKAQGTEGGSEACSGTMGGDASNHSFNCECGSTVSHAAQWEKTDKYIANAASCTSDAEYYYECTYAGCGVSSQNFGGATYFKAGTQTDHLSVLKERKEPDCKTETNGYEIYWCPACQGQEETEVIPFEHVPGEMIKIDDSIHGVECEVCKKILSEEEHSWTAIFLEVEPTCTTNGKYLYFCNGCGYEVSSEYAIDENGKFTSEFVAPALNHKVDGVSTYEYYEDADHQPLDPTCSATGYHYEKCSLCGDIKQVTDAIDPDAHVYSSAVSNGNGTHTATCTLNSAHVITDPCTDKDKDCVCDTCGYNIPHDYQNIVTAGMLVSKADCNSYAVYKKSCSVCGVAHESETFEDVASGYGAHDWAETRTFIKSVAKCETDAVYYYECLECGASSEAHGGATWTDKGTGYPHNYAPKADNSNIVNNNDGTHSYYCQNKCGTVGGTTGCNFGEWDVNNANGHQKTCRDCGYTTALEAHNWGEGWKPAEGNTGDAKGEMTRTCTVCARTETTTCVYDQEVVVEATCMNDKYTEYTCTTCGHGYTVREPGTKLDHSYTGEYDIDAENDKHRQLCVNGCNQYGEWVECELTYTQVKGTETHTATCPDCGNVDTGDCFGGTATCIQKAKCDKCGGDHGDYAEHNFTGAAKNFGVEGEHNRVCAVEGCGEYNPVAEKCSGGTAYCTEKAICSECNTAYGEIDLNNHKNTTAQPGKAPTCMDDGYTDYATCDACGTELGKEVIPADPEAHKWSATAVSTNDGKHYYACEYNAEHKDVYDCFCSSPSILPPTCEEGGYTLHVCDECPYTWTTDPTDPTDHAWGEWVKDGKGGHTRVCLNDESHTQTGTCADDATAVVTAPTCTEQGYTTYTCNLCGYVWVADYTAPTGHHYTQKIIDDAHLFTDADYEATGVTTNTCERADYYWFDCADCDKNGKDETDTDKYPLNTRYYENGKGEGHDFTGKAYSDAIKDKLVLASEATCTEHETYYTYCTKCHLSTKGIEGKEATFTRWGTALEHSFEEIVDPDNLAKNRVSVATCTAKAVYYKSCANCGEVSDETFTYGEMTAHSYTEKLSDYAHIITEANCQTKATYWFDCVYCNSNAKLIDKEGMTEEEIAALQYSAGAVDYNNHISLEKVAYKAPTCTEDGHSEYKKCTACGTELGKVTAGYEKTGHVYTGDYRIANVVDAEGNVTAYKHQRACKYGCGTYSEVTDCGFTAWQQNEDGKTHSKACVCGNSLTANCVANDNASCEDAATCKDCGGEMADTVTGHDWGEWKSDENGKTHSRVCKTNSNHKETEKCSGGVASGCGAIYCSVCSQQYATGIDHNWGEWVEVSAATCTEPAVRKRACKDCSATQEETVGKALGHDYDSDNDGKDDGVVTKEATCTEAGIITYTCLNGCGTTYTEVIKSLGHELEKEWTTKVEPTCKDEGLQVKCCVHSWKDADGNEVKCDYYEEQTIPADKSKHVPGEWVTDEGASNCETGLKSYKYCTVCGFKVDEKTDKISHEWVADSIVYGTCTANGYIKMVCAKCGSAKTFDENTPGFPNKLDDTVIDGETASKLLSKGGHKWETTASGSGEYVIQNGYVVYVTKAPTCSETGKGYMICTAEGCGTKSGTVSIDKTEHNFKTMPAAEATCQTPGHTEYRACKNCPYAEQPTKIPKLGHIDSNANGKCDRCGFEMYDPGNGGTAACGCLCHNDSFFMAKIIYPIARFFWKIFGMNKSCSCGKTHY